ncbi:MAG: bifunctional oligoribonuclease/PAP phosphatase NrnA [Deltaproteobacteria bacterium]|nr:bifunctional oligoribonuclease/PAP phosphatase NrnA [Deltaproteobacteria bacterium]
MLEKISEAIEACRTFLIVSHERPDGDALGSELAIYHLLKALGKEAVVYSQDVTPDHYRFLPGSDRIVSEWPAVAFDAAIVVDCSELDRVGQEAKRIGAIPTLINIDHHVSNGGFCEAALIDPSASSTGELVCRLIAHERWPIGPETATCLYTAILTDTGGFRYGSTSAATLRAAADLVAHGASPQFISEHVYESHAPAKIRLMAAVLPTLTLEEGGRVGSLTVTLQAIAEAGALSEHTEGFVDLPRTIRGVEISILFVELAAGRFKLSFRSKGNVNVERVARALGGGGHVNAAACRMEGALADVRRRVLEQIRISGWA